MRALAGRPARTPHLEEQVEDDVNQRVALGDSGAVGPNVFLLPAASGSGEFGTGLGEVDTDPVDE